MADTVELPEPTSEHLRLVVEADLLVLATATRLRQYWATHAAAKDLNAAQVKVLLTLTPGESIPMRTLASRMDYDASNLTTLVDRLEGRGLLERKPNEADRRVKALSLTPAGQAARDGFWRDLIASPGPLEPLTTEDVTRLIEILTKLDQSDAARHSPTVPRASPRP
jgi:DNA-binding MarR family transcriptional regulator